MDALQTFQIVDTHVHTISLDKLSYPWLDSYPDLNANFSGEAYQRQASACGITNALHMEVDVAESDIESETRYVNDDLVKRGLRFGGLFQACRPESPDFQSHYERAIQNSLVKGFRRVLHTQTSELSQSPVFRENLKLLSCSSYTFDLCLSQAQIPLGVQLADALPDVALILDHCGIPDMAVGNFVYWCDWIDELARRPNITAKISGICAYAQPDWHVETLRPYVEKTIEAFGWDRVVWGSDWPVCTLNGDLSTWVSATHAIVGGCSLDERSRLFSENAKRIWRL